MSRSHRLGGPYGAIAAVFVVHGAVAGTLAARIPWIEDRLDLGPTLLGLALLCPSVGAFVGMPTAGWLAHRFGERTVTCVLLGLWCALLPLPAIAPGPLWLCAAFLLFGAGAGMSDVAMNAHAVRVERHLERPVMSGLHGLWAVGSLIGGGIGVPAAHAGIDARLHLGVMGAVLLVTTGVAGRRLLPGRTATPGGQAPRRFALPTKAILPFALLGFCATFAEGSSANWSGVYLTEVTGASQAMAAASYTIFMCCMAAARLIGDGLVRRFGPVRVVRYGGAVATAGGILVVAARTPALGIAGFALLGIGVATVVPLVIAAAGNAGDTPGDGVAGIATSTYLSVMAAPAITGWTAGAVSYPFAFGVITAVAALLVLGAPVLRPRHAGRAEKPAAPDHVETAVSRT